MIKITNQQIEQLAKEFNLEPAMVWAVIDTESSGAGFGADGRLKIQFEPHVFSDQLDKLGLPNELKLIGKNSRGLKTYSVTYAGLTITNGVETHNAEWIAYTVALTWNKDAAQYATSFGMGQVMGFNFRLAGFNSAQEMINSFAESELNQVRGMFNFIVNCRILDELQRKDWAGFARIYNGPGYAAQGYDQKLKDSYLRRGGRI